MKSYLILLLSCLLFWECDSSKETDEFSAADTLELSRNNLKLSNTGGSFTVSVTSAGEWNASVTNGSDWLSISRSTGDGNGDLRLFFTDNTQGDKREGTVKVVQKSGNTPLEQEITVEQLGGDPDILLDYPTEKIGYEGGEFSVTVVSNVEWEVQIDEKYNWIQEMTPLANRSFTSNESKFVIAPNYDVERKGIIVFKTKGDYVLNKKVELTQVASDASLNLELTEFRIPYRYHNLIIPVDLGAHETQYRVETEDSWITWDEKASTSSQIVLNVADNDQSDELRVANVKVKNVNLEETVKVYQYGKPNLSIGDDPTVTLAFPSAEGGGRLTTGGRGGTVYHVTSLEDDVENPKEGTLRWAVRQRGARTIVFDVAGTIYLKGELKTSYPDLTIAGQTSPGGICLADHAFVLNSSNIIIRYMRFRPGDAGGGEPDGLGGMDGQDIIIDHCSVSWSVDECLSVYGSQNSTVQWCLASEALLHSTHEKGSHGYGGNWGGKNASYHHNMIAHCTSRVPRLGPRPTTLALTEQVDIRNNVFYNWAGNGCYGGEDQHVNMVNNYYKPGPATEIASEYVRYRIAGVGIYTKEYGERYPAFAPYVDRWGTFYIEGNAIEGSTKVTPEDNWTNGVYGQLSDEYKTNEIMNKIRLSSPLGYEKTTTHAASLAYERVLEYVGCADFRDGVDKRIISDVRNKVATFTVEGNAPGFINTPTDTGAEPYPELRREKLATWADTDKDGIPDIWEDAYGLDKANAGDAAQYDLDPSGRYSNLEVYLHNLVQHIVYYQNLGGNATEQK